MIPLALGLGLVVVLLWAAGSFSRAPVRGVKHLLAWVAALAGLALTALLLLAGRGGMAIAGLAMFGPLAWGWWQESRAAAAPNPPGSAPGGRMGRTEALSVLGLHNQPSDTEIQAAWLRLMRLVHPDSGGTDGLAARVNQARDTLLRR